MERRYMNYFVLVGCIVEEPERTETSAGMKLCRLKISVGKTNKDQQEESEIFEVALFRNLATEEYQVGQNIAISGRLQSSNVERDGVMFYNTRLIGNSVTLIN